MGMIRVGECSQCGACCDNFRALELVREAARKGIPTIMGSHFPCYQSYMEDGKCVCKIYNMRPPMCKEFPWCEENLIDFPECTYRFEDEKKN